MRVEAASHVVVVSDASHRARNVELVVHSSGAAQEAMIADEGLMIATRFTDHLSGFVESGTFLRPWISVCQTDWSSPQPVTRAMVIAETKRWNLQPVIICNFP
ncbi:MAG: hypothetical protein ACI9UK_001616 [Candidatus Krumholzibacteriia bacterium]|jgi:hypothetical protein